MDNREEELLHVLFRQQALSSPDKTAVVSADGRQLTFKELNDKSDVLAVNLRIKGVKPDDIVAIYMPKCIEYVISYVGILKAGGAYLPLDISYPVTLLEDVFDDAQPSVVIADPSMTKFLPKTAKSIIEVNHGWLDMLQKENDENPLISPEPKMTLDNLAYVIYSSGTTGKPKGIECPHRGAVLSYKWRFENYPYDEEDKEACNVFFVWEMLRPLLQGTSMYVIPDTIIYDPKPLCNFLQTNEITRMLFTPSLLEAVLDDKRVDVQQSFGSMRMILFCGEVVTVDLLRRCMKILPHVKFINLYSISECHDISCANLSEWGEKNKIIPESIKFCPVGKVMPDIKVVILNNKNEPQPVGVAGEIYVGGPTLARGYLNRPDLNASRYLTELEGALSAYGKRLYKTGDWGYIKSDGGFEICGRCDSMVKIRGYSIETQAVEVALLALPMVNACVVLAVGAEGDDKHLVAYIVPEMNVTKKDIRAALKLKLPFYMIPTHFIIMTSIPIVKASGKLDKKALPPVDLKSQDSDPDSLPSTETEKVIVEIWKQVLRMQFIDIQESFFDLGGHSLMVAKALNSINDKFLLSLTVKDLFENPTVSSIATHIDQLKGVQGVTEKKAIFTTFDLQQEVEKHDHAVLGLDIQIRAFWRSQQYGDRWSKATVLLTGGTGFLGAFILRDLMLNTKTHVFCLVRETPTQSLESRIRSALEMYHLLSSDHTSATKEQIVLDAQLMERLTVIKGDVGLEKMGMTDDDYTYLSTEIDVIVHSAAYVNLIYPYQALHGPNVLGTENVILFACANKIKPLHYVSTDAVFPHGLKDVSEEQDMIQYAYALKDGYSQSKWVAEQLVINAMKSGLPVAIYRPGNLAGDTKHVAWNKADFILMILRNCIVARAAPEMNWDVEFTPVDFVSEFIVTLTQRMALGLGKIYNMVNSKPVKSEWLFDWLNAHGYPMTMMPYDGWLKRINESCSDESMKDLINNMAKDKIFFENMTSYDNSNVQRVLRIINKEYPEINYNLLDHYFKQLAVQRILPLVRRNTILNQPLEGRIAFVTGASSGIGSSISQHLARAGAKVAMCARRIDKLQELKKQIEDEDGGFVMPIKCDVVEREQVAQAVKQTECVLGPVDILVNCAGVMYFNLMKNANETEWHHMIDVNCKGVINCIGALVNGMIQRGSGHIVNISSDAGRKGFAGLAVYSGTKFFVEGLSQGMRSELANTGIKVTCIQPGDVKTELISHTTDAEAKEQFDGSESSRILDPDDIGRAVLYAVDQPLHCAVNEILVEPREAPI